MAGYVALQLDQHADFKRVITIKDATGAPQDLSFATANTQIRKSYYSSSSNTIPTTITDASAGEITISMGGSDTANLSPGRYVYDVLITYSNNDRQRVLEGILVVNPGVTR